MATNSGTRKFALPCCGCGVRPRVKNQRYCRNCRNEAHRKYRLQHREELLSLRKSAKGKSAAN